MKITSFREKERGDFRLSITHIGGAADGEEFRVVTATLDDETERDVFVSNNRKGFFKQVLVPWDFEHPQIAK